MLLHFLERKKKGPYGTGEDGMAVLKEGYELVPAQGYPRIFERLDGDGKPQGPRSIEVQEHMFQISLRGAEWRLFFTGHSFNIIVEMRCRSSYSWNIVVHFPP